MPRTSTGPGSEPKLGYFTGVTRPHLVFIRKAKWQVQRLVEAASLFLPGDSRSVLSFIGGDGEAGKELIFFFLKIYLT